MKKRILKIILLICVFFSVTNFAKAEIFLETNFNNNADWQPEPAGLINDTTPAGATAWCDYNTVSCATNPPPAGWEYYKSAGWWWGPMYEDTLRIKTTAGDGTLVGRGGTGKALIVYNEGTIGSSGDGWGADGILTKLLPVDQTDLNVRFWLKTSDLHWANSRNGLKLFRTSHFDRGNTTIFQNFATGPRAPIYIYDLSYSTTYGVEQSHSLRCDPQLTDYYCPNSPAGNGDSGTHFIIGETLKSMPESPSDPGAWGDQNWHQHDFHIKMNSYLGNGNWASDGMLEFWYDGVLQKSKNNIKWINSGTDGALGWNTIEFGGNAYNWFSDAWTAGAMYKIGDRINFSGYVWECIQDLPAGFANAYYPSFSSEVYWHKIGIVTSQKIEQWYSLDDIVAYKPLVSGDPLWATSPQDGRLPMNYVVGNLVSDVISPAAPAQLLVN